MITCNCRNCGRQFVVGKPMPFCCGSCRITHQTKQSQKMTIHVGVNTSDKSSIEQNH
jgi:endogenous inhibitor of DNA gyrase (YacG/DUF329 family)